jgi:hypothetical protein
MWEEENVNVESEIVPAAVVTTMARGEGGDSPLALLIGNARNIDRSPKRLIERAKQVGGLLAGDGFYRFPAGGANVEGESIDLAEALAQEWGAISYEVLILNTENLSTGGRKVHFRARVTDFKTLVMASVDGVTSTSAPPGGFAKKDEQRERWHSMQVQSAASKIARNAILRVLPNWYTKPALQAAMDADAQSATRGKSLPEARKGAMEHLAGLGFTQGDLETFTGQPLDMWAAPQLAQLRDLAGDIKGSRVSVEQIKASLHGESAPTAPAPTGKATLGLSDGKKIKPTVEAAATVNAE